MKKRTAFVGAILSLIPLGQPLLIKTGMVLSSSALMLSLPEKVQARDNSYYFNSAYDKAQRGDHYGAISDYTKAIEINPQYAKAFYNRGISKGKLKDYYGAISDYTKAIEVNPNYKSAYKNRGIAKEQIGDLKGACSDWRQTVYLSPNDAAAKWVRDLC